MGDNVGDEGTCPYLTSSGTAQTWRSDCRSQDGYDWDGIYTVDEVAQGSWTEFDYTFGLIVASDVEGRAFDFIELNGRMFYVDGDDEPMVRSSQSNVTIEVGGYWSRGFEDELEQAWSKLGINGRWENQIINNVDITTIDATVDLGELGGFTATGTLTDDGCMSEPLGVLTLVGAQTAVLTFHGNDACDGCAELTVNGVDHANACRGF
jgi:hypothetical protein